MVDLWFLSDTHFGHGACCLKFQREDGSPLRDFKSVEEMDEHLIERWNSVVKPQDHVYHLGDVAMKRSHLHLVKRCNGHKRLIRGNHDIFRTQDYLEYFDEIYGSRTFDNLIFTHIPIHVESLSRFRANVHGHLHHKTFQVNSLDLTPNGYLNISVEMLDNYTPLHLDQIREMVG